MEKMKADVSNLKVASGVKPTTAVPKGSNGGVRPDLVDSKPFDPPKVIKNGNNGGVRPPMDLMMKKK